VLLKSIIKSVANKINSLELKERDITTSLLSKFAISEITLCCRYNIITKNSSNSTFIEFKNLSITLIVLNYKESNVNKQILLF